MDAFIYTIEFVKEWCSIAKISQQAKTGHGNDGSTHKAFGGDDEEGIRDVTEGYFMRKGYEVYTAENGAQAWIS